MNIVLLGTGTSTGIPVVGCRCRVCCSADPHNQRTRCSALLSCGGHNLLIDTATDLRQQALREDIQHIDAVLYTHCHADHVHGIDDLRGFNVPGGNPIPLYADPQTLISLRRNFKYIFDPCQPPGYVPKLTLHPLAGPMDLFGLEIIPIPLRHGAQPATGYRCGPFAYLTDCNRIPDSSLALLKGLELLVLDGLRFKPHPTHFNIPAAVAIAQSIGAKQTLLTHLSHDVDHAGVDADLPDGINLAYDGQRFSFDVPYHFLPATGDP
ncbi:MBL fold metallo-hydrolase [Pelobacter sp. M08fum]|uniref:MBL fold metallo-hydrolase n=1 Tax=Pelovirga terrestris TaxID=2771352 RepID=A0A8J6QXB9_9BACT|nr:MBL fold metallo-hydrolase [Pelovirga terrestris]